jgi:predicted nucleic acid-binding protein
LQEKLSLALDLENLNLIIENALGRNELAEEACLQIKHVCGVILEYIKESYLSIDSFKHSLRGSC